MLDLRETDEISFALARCKKVIRGDAALADKRQSAEISKGKLSSATALLHRTPLKAVASKIKKMKIAHGLFNFQNALCEHLSYNTETNIEPGIFWFCNMRSRN